jgi:hypothetical protein
VNCLACGRRLTRFAFSVPTKDGAVGWGPKCARQVLKRPKRRRAARVIEAAPAVEIDPRQMPLQLEASA